MSALTAGAPVDGTMAVHGAAAVRLFWSRVAGTVASRLALVALGLATSVIAARVLGPAGLGVLMVMFTTGALGVQFGHLGLPSALTYYVAADRSRLPALIGMTLAASLGGGSLIAVSMFLVMTLVPALSPLDDPWLLGAALAWIPLGLLSLLLLNLSLGLGRLRLYNGVQVAQAAGVLAATVALVVLASATVTSLYLASFAALALATAPLIAALVREAGARATLPGRTLVRSAVGYGFRAWIALLLSFTVLKFDLLMVSRMVGRTEAGHYAVAAAAGELVTLPFAALGAVLFANVAAASASWPFARSVAVRSGVVLVPVLLLVALCARPAIALVYGAEFLPATMALLILLPGLWCLAVNTVLMHYFAGVGMPAVTMIGPAIGAVANIGLNVALLPRYGIAGAAVASTVAYALMLLASTVHIHGRGAA